MKFPSLTRVLSIVLLILSLALIGVGVAGIRDAENEKSTAIRKAELMDTRLDTYEEYKHILKDKKKYSEALEEYNKLKEEYDSDHAEHKTDVAIHTATEGGIVSGKQQLWDAEGQLQSAYGQLNLTVDDFNNHGATYQSVVGAAREALHQNADYQSAVAGLSQINSGLENINGLAAAYETLQGMLTQYSMTQDQLKETLESAVAGATSAFNTADTALKEAEAARAEFVTACNEKEASYNSAAAAYDAAKADYDSTPDESADVKDEKKTAMDNAEAAMTSAKTEYDTAKQALADKDAELGYDKKLTAYNESKTAKEAAEANLQGFSQLAASVLYINDVIGAAHDTPVTADSYAALLAKKTELETTKATVEQQIQAADDAAVKAATDAFNQKIDESVKALNEAYSQIYAAGAEINYKEWQLPKEQEELLERKLDLDKRAKELAEMDAENEKLKVEEKKFTSARILLESNEQIKTSLDSGTELEEATRNEIERFTDELNRTYEFRLIICYMLLGAAFFGILELFPAFEKIKSQFLRIAFVVLFILLCAGAEYLSVYIGRGHMYSALASAAVGFLCLLFIAPNAKKPSFKIDEPAETVEESSVVEM